MGPYWNDVQRAKCELNLQCVVCLGALGWPTDVFGILLMVLNEQIDLASIQLAL